MAIDEGTRQARYRACTVCKFHCLQSASVRAVGKVARFCTFDLAAAGPEPVEGAPDHLGRWADWRVRDEAFMTGPAGNCPLTTVAGGVDGYEGWDRLPAVDLAAEAAEQKKRVLDYQRGTLAPVVAALLEGLNEEQKTARLLAAVEARLIEPETADEIVEGAIEPRRAQTAV